MTGADHVYDLTIPSAVEASTTLVVPAAAMLLVDAAEASMGAAPLITDQTTLNIMRGVVVGAKEAWKTIEARRQEAKRPFLDICAAIDKAAKPYLDRLQNVVDEGKAQQAQFAIDEEARQKKEEDERRAAEAVALKTSTRPTAPIIAPVLHDQLQMPLTSRTDVEIVDLNLIPREYFMLDMAKLRHAMINERKAVPGAKVVNFQNVVAR